MILTLGKCSEDLGCFQGSGRFFQYDYIRQVFFSWKKMELN